MTRSSPGSARPEVFAEGPRVLGGQLGHLRLDRRGDGAQGAPAGAAKLGEAGALEVDVGVPDAVLPQVGHEQEGLLRQQRVAAQPPRSRPRTRSSSRSGFSASRPALSRTKSSRSATSSACFAFLMFASSRSRRRSTVARSARISSSSSTLASRSGSIEPSGWGTVSDSKARTTWTRASTPRSAGRSTSAEPSSPGHAGHVDVLDGGRGPLLRVEDLGEAVDPGVGHAGDADPRLGPAARSGARRCR